MTLAASAGRPPSPFGAVKRWKYVPPSPPGVRPKALNRSAMYCAALSRPGLPSPRPFRSGEARNSTWSRSACCENTGGRSARAFRPSAGSGGSLSPRRSAGRRSTLSGESDCCHWPLMMLAGSSPWKPEVRVLPVVGELASEAGERRRRIGDDPADGLLDVGRVAERGHQRVARDRHLLAVHLDAGGVDAQSGTRAEQRSRPYGWCGR